MQQWNETKHRDIAQNAKQYSHEKNVQKVQSTVAVSWFIDSSQNSLLSNDGSKQHKIQKSLTDFPGNRNLKCG
jgi:hypothetical protein